MDDQTGYYHPVPRPSAWHMESVSTTCAHGGTLARCIPSVLIGKTCSGASRPLEVPEVYFCWLASPSCMKLEHSPLEQ
jgi:hypothetical protein